jgi:hypothetical protein
MAVEDDALVVADGCRRIMRGTLQPSDFVALADELARYFDDEQCERLRFLLDWNRSEQDDDESLLENWGTIKEEIICGRIYGFVRANFSEFSHELLEAAYWCDEPLVTGKMSVAEENEAARVPFTFHSTLTDEILARFQIPRDSAALRGELRRALKRERHRRRIIRITRWVLREVAYIGVVLLAIALWKLLKVAF